MANDYKIIAQNTLQGPNMTYVIPLFRTIRGPGNLGGTSIALDKPVNNKIFSLSGKTEQGSFEFEAFERFNPENVDSVYNDRSYDEDQPAGQKHTLDYLISQLESGTSAEQEEATRLKNRFTQDSAGNYVVRTVQEQRIWLKEYVHNPGLSAEWTIFGPGFTWRTSVSGTANGTPVFLESADIEPSGDTKGRGVGSLQFKVGGRL